MEGTGGSATLRSIKRPRCPNDRKITSQVVKFDDLFEVRALSTLGIVTQIRGPLWPCVLTCGNLRPYPLT